MQTLKNVFEVKKNPFVSYVMVGDHGINSSLEYARTLIECGIDILELGMPFSDPAADGQTILEAGLRALKEKITLEDVLSFAKTLRTETQIPMVLMSYLNPLYQYGFEKLCKALKEVGIEGLIIPDLPYEESEVFKKIAKQNGIIIISLIALTTSEKRIQQIVKSSEGFLYLVAVKGITGTQAPILKEVISMNEKIKKYTDLPVVAGFGIKTNEEIKALNEHVQGVVVASRFIELREAGRIAEIKKIMGI